MQLPRDPCSTAADRLIAIERAERAAMAELEHLSADDRRAARQALAARLAGVSSRELHDAGPEPTR